MYAGGDIVDMKVEQYKAAEAMVLNTLNGRSLQDGMDKIKDLEKKIQMAKEGKKVGEHHGLEGG